MSDLEAQFWDFAATAKIPSRDEGVIPFRPYGTQRHVVREVFKAVEQDKRDIIVLKARQLGITVVFVVFDCFWMQKHPGLQGAFVADEEANKEFFRDQIKELHAHLPPKWRIPVRLHNKVQLAWEDIKKPDGSRRPGSHLAYHVAGTRKNKKLGQSRGIAYLHATEVSTWGDPEGIRSLRASISKRHPARLSVWESTAKGYNHFWDMWQTAQRASTHAAIFAGWWLHEMYSTDALPNGKAIFDIYWDGRLSGDESSWSREIHRRWDIRISPQQWAWYRYMLAEDQGDQGLMHQNYPTLPEHAFQASGSNYIGSVVLGRLRESCALAPTPTTHRYSYGRHVEDLQLHETAEELCDLVVWEQPLAKAGERSRYHYIIAADPAFGSSEKSDRSVCTVWRATSLNTLIQCASFASSQVSMTHFAWIVCHLAGAYMNSYNIVELNGPGFGVLQEIHRLQMWGWGSSKPSELGNVFGNIQHYLYKRPDSLRSQYAYQWKTTMDTKPRIMGRLKDQLTLGNIDVRDPELVAELATIRQEGNIYTTEGNAHDDRVITAALAVEYWTERVAHVVSLDPSPPDREGGEEEVQEAPPAHERALHGFLARLQHHRIPSVR